MLSDLSLEREREGGREGRERESVCNWVYGTYTLRLITSSNGWLQELIERERDMCGKEGERTCRGWVREKSIVLPGHGFRPG